MEKRVYNKPVTEVIEMEIACPLLDGSIPIKDGEGNFGDKGGSGAKETNMPIDIWDLDD